MIEIGLAAVTGKALKEMLETLSNSKFTLFIEYSTEQGKRTLLIAPFEIKKSMDENHTEAIVVKTKEALKLIGVHSITSVRVGLEDTKCYNDKAYGDEVDENEHERQIRLEGDDLSILTQIGGNPLSTDDFI